MGRNSKWIESRPDESARRVARRALELRLDRVWHYLQLSVEGARSETENVHQLRVFARRTAAALDIFSAWLPNRRGQWMQKQIKRVRKAAGAARDFDVLLMRWREGAQRAPAGPAGQLVEQIERHRHEAQAPIEAIHEKLLAKRFGRRASKLLKRVHKPSGQDACGEHFGCMARVSLGQLVVPYLEAAKAELADADALHEFRIQGKQVRYAMEIFAGAFDVAFRQDLYLVVESLQERLGAINDHVTAKAHFVAWHGASDRCDVRQALEFGIEHEERSLAVTSQDFLAWWSAERREDLRRRFAPYVDLPGTDKPTVRLDACG